MPPETDKRKIAGMLLVALTIGLLWHTPFVYPLKLLVVFFHELSHVIVTLLTGGQVLSVELLGDDGGKCVTRGGVLFLVLNAGYLGSTLFGGVLLLLGTRTPYERYGVAGIALVLFGVLPIFLRHAPFFLIVYALLAGVLCFVASLLLSRAVNGILLQLVGMVSCFYAFYDIASDILPGSEGVSDAALLARITGIPEAVWGVVWLGLAAALTVQFLKIATEIDNN